MPAKGQTYMPQKVKRGKRVRSAARRATAPASKGTAKRTAARLAVTGPVAGVNAKDGFTKREAKLVRKARARQKFVRGSKRYVKKSGGDPRTYDQFAI